MRVIQLISESSELRETEVKTIEDYYKLLDASVFDVARVNWEGQPISIYVDDMGMLQGQKYGRVIEGYLNPLFGNLIIAGGVSPDGEQLPLPEEFTLENVKSRISKPMYIGG